MIEKFEKGKKYVHIGNNGWFGDRIIECTEVGDGFVHLDHDYYSTLLGSTKWKDQWSEVYNYKGKWLVVGREYYVSQSGVVETNRRVFAFVQEGRAWFRALATSDPDVVIAWPWVSEVEESRPVTEYHLVKTENGEEKSRTKLTDDQKKELGI